MLILGLVKCYHHHHDLTAIIMTSRPHIEHCILAKIMLATVYKVNYVKQIRINIQY